MNKITQMLEAVGKDDPLARDKFLELVYGELRQLAAARLAHEPSTQTLQTTALVHEAWLRLQGDDAPHWQNRRHFFGAAAEAMRRILIDRARRKRAARHGGQQQRVDVNDVEIAAPSPDDELIAVHEVLDRFAAVAPEKAELVKLRYFAGLTLKQVAEVLCISEPTAKRYWAYARAWLFRAWQNDGAKRPPAPQI